MKTIIVVIPPKPVSGLSVCLAAWEGRLKASVATSEAIPHRGEAMQVPARNRKPGSFATFRFDGIVLMDGLEGQGYPLNYHAWTDQLQAYDKHRMLIAAAGNSCLVLARAGLLLGKQATTSSVPAAIEALRRYGGIYKASPVVRSGWLITADGTNMKAFANAIAESLHV
ncbi:DJ-1/PfpI family protein [Pseudomonas abietaniphila]|uniref:DJ-1/PfpI family protein n=1 Tax=Pseudomonas abietaniphila TaxID=89065 RepID=UPI0032179698